MNGSHRQRERERERERDRLLKREVRQMREKIGNSYNN
jgi:hypothetical protein